MCLLVLAPRGADPMAEDSIRRAWAANPDGAGYAYVAESGRVVTFKSLDRDEFIRNYRKDAEEHGFASSFLIHFRWATHGATDERNVHPFPVGDDVVMGHNGVITDVAIPPGDERSDTAVFAEVVSAFPMSSLDDPDFIELLEDSIGYSKLAFLSSSLDTKYEWYIINEQLGEWVNGVWYSNDSWRTSPRWVYYGSRAWTASVNDDDDDWWPELVRKYESKHEVTPACEFCAVELAPEDGDYCPACSSCQVCWEVWEHCTCDSEYVSIHDLSDEEVAKLPA